MIKRLVVLPLLLAGALLVSGCGGGGQEPLSPAPAPGQPAPLAKYAKPANLQIPDLEIDSKIVPIQMDAQQKLSVESLDDQPELTGWFEKSAMPGQRGPVILAGHVNYDGPGVFGKLHNIKPGAKIQVGDAQDRAWTYQVTRVITQPKTNFPTEAVYGRTDDEKMVLVTCGGPFDSTRRAGDSSGSYRDNVIVFATLV